MNRNLFRKLVGSATVLILAAAGVQLASQPKLKTAAPSSYVVGDIVDGNTLLTDKNLNTRKLSEIVKPGSRAVVLAILGGAAPSAPDHHPLRGGLWCPDTFDDLPLQRALIRQFKDDPVQFVAVAAPPAYSDVYGFVTDVFTTKADDDPLLMSQIKTFIELTEKTKETDVMPYSEIYYDPKFRLAQDKKREVGPDYGPIYDWQGKLRWHRDPRKYTTPSIWILDGSLKLVRKPFVGNDYNDDPPQIRYSFEDVKKAIQEMLGD